MDNKNNVLLFLHVVRLHHADATQAPKQFFTYIVYSQIGDIITKTRFNLYTNTMCTNIYKFGYTSICSKFMIVITLEYRRTLKSEKSFYILFFYL